MRVIKAEKPGEIDALLQSFEVPTEIEEQVRWHAFFKSARPLTWPRCKSAFLSVVHGKKIVGCCSVYRYPYPLPFESAWMRRTARTFFWPANPVNMQGLPVISKGNNPEEVYPALLEAIDKLRVRWLAPAIRLIMLDAQNDAPLIEYLKRANYLLEQGIVKNTLEVSWDNFEGYFEKHLRSKTRRLLRKAHKNATGAGVTFQPLTNPSKEQDRICELLQNVADKNKSEVIWSERFLEKEKTYLKERKLVVLGSYLNGKLIGCTVNFNQGSEFVMKSIGLDYSCSEELNLYRLMLLQGIRYSIEAGYSTLNAGFSQYAIKRRLGFSQENTLTAVKSWPLAVAPYFAYRSASMIGETSHQPTKAEGSA
ncbi:GNAT family N-acetyltransferase [Flexibacterium corallicola]|uniref:GNAT family N-acetyltransferase n=1 Tax=Flexibacterium corallicola TaxID=3037259 RepID=UPI00286F03BA|nr:GNAT family N-acetyltransferase [Pseudovibrio sp. M1P-2-3]